MEKVMSLPLHEDVQSLYRLLQAQGVRLLIVEENGEQVIYVESKEQAAAVQEAYSCYRTDHNMSQQVDRYWQKAAPLQRTPVIVWPTLLASPCVSLLLFSLLFVGVWTGFGRFDNHRDFLIVDRFHTDFMVDSHSVDVLWQLLLDGQFLRLLAPAWLHWSVLHWLFNSLGLWILGRSLENYL
jgi:GlpG protein